MTLPSRTRNWQAAKSLHPPRFFFRRCRKQVSSWKVSSLSSQHWCCLFAESSSSWWPSWSRPAHRWEFSSSRTQGICTLQEDSSYSSLWDLWRCPSTLSTSSWTLSSAGKRRPTTRFTESWACATAVWAKIIHLQRWSSARDQRSCALRWTMRSFVAGTATILEDSISLMLETCLSRLTHSNTSLRLHRATFSQCSTMKKCDTTRRSLWSSQSTAPSKMFSSRRTSTSTSTSKTLDIWRYQAFPSAKKIKTFHALLRAILICIVLFLFLENPE